METDIEFVTCPKCRGRQWADLPDTQDKNRCRYRCCRCGHLIVLGGCSSCKTSQAWIQTKGIDPRGGQKPFYRYECRNCHRVVGILID